MARPTTKPRTHVQRAMIALRSALGDISQQDLAVKLHVAVATVSRWETSHFPSDASLRKLYQLAIAADLPEIAFRFRLPWIYGALDESIGILSSGILDHMSHEMLREILPRLERLAVVAEDIRTRTSPGSNTPAKQIGLQA